MLSGLATWIESVIEKIGYLGVALLVGLENVIPIIPSEIVQPYAGFVAQRDNKSVVLMIIVATIGSVLGSLVMYGIAAWIGPVRLRVFIVRYGKFVGVSEHELTRAEEWFDRNAVVSVLIGRCVPLIRSVVSIPAGFRKMKLIPYIICTFIGSLLWNIFLIGAGAMLGDNWESVTKYMSAIQYVVVAAIFVVVVRFVWTHLKRRKANKTTS
jgi:membrane protein DedA with SNARE-associated domain